MLGNAPFPGDGSHAGAFAAGHDNTRRARFHFKSPKIPCARQTRMGA
jgi:hypothetical protein